jgi:hypothetical protein
MLSEPGRSPNPAALRTPGRGDSLTAICWLLPEIHICRKGGPVLWCLIVRYA